MIKRGLELIFKRRDFGLLMGTQFLAQAGDGIVQVGLAKLIVFGGQRGFDLEGARTPDDLLRIALYIFIPYTILSPFLGVVIDRWDRRRLLFLANGMRAGVILMIAIAGTTNVGDVPLFLAFLLTLMSTRVVLATKAAALPTTLQGSSLVEGNAVSQMGGALFQLGGAGVALVASGLLNTEPIIMTGAVVYAAGAVFPLAIERAGETRVTLTVLEEAARVIRNIVAGLREVARTPKAGASITTYFWLRLLWSFSLVGIGFVARELLADDDMQVLLVTGGAGGIGAMTGFVLARRLHARVGSTAHLVLAASAVAGVAIAVLGTLELRFTLAFMTLCLGFGFFLAKISLDTMVQEALGDGFRGRAFALYDIAYNLAWVLAAAAMKILWTEGTQGELISGMGFVFLAGMVGIGMWFRAAGLLRPSEPARAPSEIG
jgi:hypothetical protein